MSTYNIPYENSNNMRLVFSRCAPAQRHLTWELKQNTCEPCNASTTTRYDRNQSKTHPGSPSLDDNLLIRSSWSMVSNAALKSSNTRSTTLF